MNLNLLLQFNRSRRYCVYGRYGIAASALELISSLNAIIQVQRMDVNFNLQFTCCTLIFTVKLILLHKNFKVLLQFTRLRPW